MYEKTPKTVNTFRADMLVQKGWQLSLDKMKTSTTVGCVFVDGKPLRSGLLNTVHGMLESMKALLLVKAREEAIKSGGNFGKRCGTFPITTLRLPVLPKLMIVVHTARYTRPASWTSYDQKGAFASGLLPLPVYVAPIPDIHAVRPTDAFLLIASA